MARNVRIEGVEETMERLGMIGNALKTKKVSRALDAGTTIYARALRDISPRGPTGNLAKSWIHYAATKGLSDTFLGRMYLAALGPNLIQRGPAAFALGKWRRPGGRSGAPHLHLVLFGARKYDKGQYLLEQSETPKTYPTKAKALRMVTRGGQVIFRRYTGPMPANEFFTPTVRTWKPFVKLAVEAALKDLFESEARLISQS